ncbi:MAG: hypothetical protein U0746_13800 [Gemmataceae bacterium]
MPAIFDDGGIRFLYPDNWAIERTDHDAGWAVTIQGPDTAFLTIAFRDDETDPAAVADAAVQALRDEYPSLETEPAVESIAGSPAVGYDARFLSLDLPVTAQVRALSCIGGSLLVLTQVAELDSAKCGPVLAAILASLRLDD